MGIFLNLSLLFTVLVTIYPLIWSKYLIPHRSLWGQLMSKYALANHKMDIVRGRAVPTPPFANRKSEQILDNLNPYDSSPDLRLLLDLISWRSGLGLALKTLAALEVDVQNNWRPFKFRVEARGPGLGLELIWKDPLAVLYVMPVPKSMKLFYGIEITSLRTGEKIIEIVGFEEKRYYQQIFKTSSSNVELKRRGDKFEYKETFPDLNEPVTVELWTIVDGQLIAKSSGTMDITRQRVSDPKSKEETEELFVQEDFEIEEEEEEKEDYEEMGVDLGESHSEEDNNEVTREVISKPSKTPKIELVEDEEEEKVSPEMNKKKNRAKSLTNLVSRSRRKSMEQNHPKNRERSYSGQRIKKSRSCGNKLQYSAEKALKKQKLTYRQFRI